MTGKQVIAVDLGAESGRVMQAILQRDRVELQEIHRFPNIPVQLRDTLHWDILRLWQEIQEGIKKSGVNASSIGVDTWGIDFGLLDRNGNLLANPVHYRDKRTDGMMDWVFDRVPRRTIFERTGIQFMPINTLYQLASFAACDSPLLDAGATLLTIPI
jgi:rhamnulokinase